MSKYSYAPQHLPFDIAGAENRKAELLHKAMWKCIDGINEFHPIDWLTPDEVEEWTFIEENL